MTVPIGRSSVLAIVLTGLAGIVACADEPRGGGARGSIRVEVAPLGLTAIVDAEYSLTVRNSLDEVVWSAGPLASSRYGDGGGALSFVGPCDATANPHTVELVLVSLTDSNGPLVSPRDFVNPTTAADGSPSPIVQEARCAESADAPVTFDLTILRRAQQGFFDFAVEFDDIFCSAKLDCPKAFLHDSAGVRRETVIVAFACTGGKADPTHLYQSDVVLHCPASLAIAGQTDITHVLSTAGIAPGQQGPVVPGIFEWSLYAGREFPGHSDLEKCFRNIAIGLDVAALAGRSCTVSAIATASQTPLSGFSLPTGGAYPFVRWQVQVLFPDGSLCGPHALDDPEVPGVTTSYVTTAASAANLPPLTATMPCGLPPPVACVEHAAYGEVTATAVDDGFELSTSRPGVAPATFSLPVGYGLGSSCCAPACCDRGTVAWCERGGDFGAISARPTATGFRLASHDDSVAPAGFELPTGYRLSGDCCKPSCCGAPTVTCQADGAFGAVSVVSTDSGFDLHASDEAIEPVGFTLPAGYAIGSRCCTPGCCN